MGVVVIVLSLCLSCSLISLFYFVYLCTYQFLIEKYLLNACYMP